MNYIYKIRRKSDNKFYYYPRPSEINRQIRRGRALDYWNSEKKGKKFYSVPQAMEYIHNELLLHKEEIEIVPFEAVITYVECESIQINDACEKQFNPNYL